MRTKLTLLILISIFIFGCTKPNPCLGKWQLSEGDRNTVIEILEGGNLVHKHPDGKMTTGQWLVTEGGGGIVMTIDGYNATAFVYEGSLLVSEDREVYTFERL